MDISFLYRTTPNPTYPPLAYSKSKAMRNTKKIPDLQGRKFGGQFRLKLRRVRTEPP